MKLIKKCIPVLLALAVIFTGFSLKARADLFVPTEVSTRAYYIAGQKYKENPGIFSNEKELAKGMSEIEKLLGNEVSEEVMLERLHAKKAVLREAERLGIYITDQEFNQKLNDLKSDLERFDDGYSDILAFCAGAEISVEEYWRISSPIYKEHWTTGKLFKALREQFIADNPDKNRQEIYELYYEFYKDYVNELKLKYDKENGNDDVSGEYSALNILRLLF